MKLWPVVMLLASCAGMHPCITNCGIMLEDTKYWTCEELQEIEDISMREFQQTLDPRLKSCKLARGWELKQMTTESFDNGEGGAISGATYCEKATVVIGKAKPKESAFTHELVHVLQQCVPTKPYYGAPWSQEWYHSNWSRDGINEAIERAAK